MAMQPADAVALLNRMYEEIYRRRQAITEEENYYRGESALRFASAKFREYCAHRYEGFSDNWCQPVANSPLERQHIGGFRLDEDPVANDAEKQLWNDWLANDMEAQASQGLLTSLIARRSYALVWGRSVDARGDQAEGPVDEPVVTWEHPSQVTVFYDPEQPRIRVAGLKTWRDETSEYATLYTTDEVWKWQRTAISDGRTRSGLIVPGQVVSLGGWEKRQPASDDTWPLPNPMGEVPIVEFANRPMLAGGPISEIRGTMAMQDAINLLWSYLFNAADYASLPARVVMAGDVPSVPILDEQGQVVGEKPVDMRQLAEDRLLFLTGENARIGQWDAARLDVFTGVIETSVSHIAAQTRTPPHYLILGKGLVNINADGMRAAEAGLVKKVQEQQVFFGPSVREVFRLMALARDNKRVAEQARIGTVQWRDAENRSMAQVMDMLVKAKAVGFPFEWMAEQYGLGQTELARVLEMKAREDAQDPVGALSRQLGQQAGPPAPPVDAAPVG